MFSVPFKSMRSICPKGAMRIERENSPSTQTQTMMSVVALVFLPLLLSGTWAEGGDLGQVLATVRNRMRCSSDPKCLDVVGVQRLLRTQDFKDINSEDLAVVLTHHMLHGDSSCTIQIPRLDIVEEEVMRAIETEDINGILQTFRRVLKDGGKAECIGTETILREMPTASSSYSPMLWVRSVLGVLMKYVLKGHCLDDGAHSGNALDDLFHRYGDTCSPYMTVKGLKKIMLDLENAGDSHDHHHHHHHHGHEHPHNDHHNHQHECDSHDHSHHDHSHHDHNPHDHSHHDHSNHYHNDHENLGHYNTDYDHPNNHNHTIHDHGNHDHTNNYKSNNTNHEHNSHDHHGHNHSSHDHQPNHDHGGYNHSVHEQNNHNIPYKEHGSHNHSDYDSRTYELNPVYSETFDIGNSSQITDTNGTEDENETLVSDNEKYTEVLENVFASRLSDVLHSTTLASEESNLVSKVFPPLNSHGSTMSSQCLSAESLVSRFGSDQISISKAEFLRLCPVLVQQTVEDVCAEKHVPSDMPSRLEVYGYGSACVFVLCLASLSGVLLLPLMRRNARHYVIAGFQGLAFSTLASDALLHLLPECLGLHSHDHSHGHSHASFPEPYAQLMLGFLATAYVLFMTEAILCALGHSHDANGRGHTHVHHISEPTLISIKTKSASQLPISTDQSCSSLDTEIVEIDAAKKPPNLMVSQPVICGLTSVALVITLGDALHNFGDGLAIGAAFSANIRGGLSTTAAAFCHELPHELGDFVVLLSTGLSFSRALWLNFLSGLTCFAGLYVGIIVGDNNVARQWVMAVTASTFLYVALAEMVPELREHRHGTPFKMLLVKNIGIIAGIAIMCVISIYEHDMA